jgi:hypothetical protein
MPSTVPNPPSHRRVPAQRRRVSGVEEIRGLPLITIALDRDGVPAAGAWWTLLSGLDVARATDLVVFAHGHNAPGASAWRRPSLSRSFLGLFPPLLDRYTASDRRTALLDLRWPARRWPDEPLPGVDGVTHTDPWSAFGAPAGFGPPPPPGSDTWQATLAAFEPVHRERVDELLALLALRPDDGASLARARRLIRDLGGATDATGRDDALFADFGRALADVGVLTDPEDDGAEPPSRARLWHGAQEATRQLTYRRLEGRAAVVGERGLGPLLARLHAARPEIGLNLVGHGIGAGVIAHALRALPDPAAGTRPPIGSVTLLQAALPDTTFTEAAGAPRAVAGPITACYSRYDTALGRFHPLADGVAGAPAGRAETLGHHGHRAPARELPLHPPGVPYDLTGPGPVSIDASRVVRRGRPPSGAHADVCHPDLAWVVLSAAGLG